MEKDNKHIDIRSTKHILVPYCALAQGIRADGIVKHYSAVVKDVIEYLTQEKINIMQMPCPELDFDGYKRPPHNKKYYENLRGYREECRRIALDVVKKIRGIQSVGYDIIGILGVNYSPSCAVDFIRFNEQGTGIYIEELKKALKENNLLLPLIGIENGRMGNTMDKLKQLIKIHSK